MYVEQIYIQKVKKLDFFFYFYTIYIYKYSI